jgi:hypothetical protein
MKHTNNMLRAFIFLTLLVASFGARAEAFQPAADPIDPFKDYRFCGEPVRNPDGSIKRSPQVLSAFRKIHPCPSTGRVGGACPGWQMNHVIPLYSGGCDAVTNLDWMPDEIKTCAQPWCRDRWERVYYHVPHGIITWAKKPNAAASSAP